MFHRHHSDGQLRFNRLTLVSLKINKWWLEIQKQAKQGSLQSGQGRAFPQLTNNYKSLAWLYPYKGSHQTLVRVRGHDGLHRHRLYTLKGFLWKLYEQILQTDQSPAAAAAEQEPGNVSHHYYTYLSTSMVLKGLLGVKKWPQKCSVSALMSHDATDRGCCA